MAAATLIEIPSSVEMPAGAVSPNNESQVLGAIAIALGMDPNSKNEFQVPDVDFLQVWVVRKPSARDFTDNSIGNRK